MGNVYKIHYNIIYCILGYVYSVVASPVLSSLIWEVDSSLLEEVEDLAARAGLVSLDLW